MDNNSIETEKILNAESREQLLKTRDEKLAKVMKMQIALNELRRLKVPEHETQIKRALKVISIGDYVHLGENDEQYLLDLQEIATNVELSYTERKSVRELLIDNLRSKLKPIVEFGHKMRSELPDIMNGDASDKLSPTQQKILDLESEKREKQQKLIELLHRKCLYLKAAAELKMGPYLANQLELVQAQAHTHQVKVELLRSFFINELTTRTDRSLEAHKIVEAHIDELLAKIDEDEK